MTIPEVRPTNPISGAGTVASDAESDVAGAAKGFGSNFSANNVAEQFLIWGVLQQIIGAALTPAVTAISGTLNEAEPIAPLSAQEEAVAVVRGIIASGAGQDEAALSGINAQRFQQLVELAQQPPSLGLLIQAAQRQLGLVGPGMSAGVDLDTALADLGIGEQYRPLVQASVFVQPSAEEVYNAWLEGQIEEGEATQRILATGLDPTWVTTGYNAQGQAPTPVEALEMLNRGIIVEGGTGPASTSYEQAFLEGPWRNKWLPAFRALGVYVPPPRTVTALLRAGTITEGEALAYFEQSGLSATTAAQYVADASSHASAAARELTQAQIVDLYESKLISEAEAHTQLVALRFSASDATLLLSLADQKAATASIKQAVTRLRDLYLAGNNTAPQTTAALSKLGLPDAQVTQLLAAWALEGSTASKTLSASEIATALFYTVIDQPTAQARVEAQGYTAHDAWIILSNRAHGPLPDEPGA